MAKTKTKGKAPKPAGKRFKSNGTMAPTIFSGLNEDRMKAGSGRFADRVEIKKGGTVTVQFLTDISGFKEIDQHQFRDGKRWNYIPCGGDGCPMCADDDEEVAKQNYRFFASVYDFSQKRVALLEGPKTLSRMLSERYKKNPKAFMSRTWDISKMDTQPVTYDVDRGELDPVSTKGLTLIDIPANILAQFQYHFGDSVDVSLLNDDDVDGDALDDEVVTKKALKKMVKADDVDGLRTVAKNFGVKGTKKMDPTEMMEAILEAQG